MSPLDGLNTLLAPLFGEVVTFLPKLAAAFLALFVGWFAARAIRVMVIRSVSGLDQLWRRLVLRRDIGYPEPRRPRAHIIGNLVYWLVITLSVALAAQIMGLGVFVSWLKQLVGYLPLVLSALLIVLAGFIISSLARDLTTSAAMSAGLSHGDMIGRLVQAIILVITIMIGVEQVGVDVTLIVVVAGVVLATMFGGLAIAFGLGAQMHLRNVLAANQARQYYQTGDRVRIGDVEGRIAEITVSRLILDAPEGSVSVPAGTLEEHTVLLLERASTHAGE